jgi:hypothetical protein
LRVLKWAIEVTDKQTVQLPVGAEILCVQAQHGRPCIWALVDGEVSLSTVEPRVLFTHGTGHETSPDIGCYIGTYQLESGAFVGHVFELRTGIGSKLPIPVAGQPVAILE